MSKEIFKELNEICVAQEKKAFSEKDENAAYHFFLASTILNEDDFAKIDKNTAIDLLNSLLEDEKAAQKLYKTIIKNQN